MGPYRARIAASYVNVQCAPQERRPAATAVLRRVKGFRALPMAR